MKGVVFLSHASSDGEIAELLKRAIESCFPQVRVFVSTDPEDLSPGDPWVEKILENLRAAKMVLLLATDRGVGRRWVWFEAGAGWSRIGKIIPCCVGKIRKGQLPPPFSLYQALNIDEAQDLELLLEDIRKVFGSMAKRLNYPATISELMRLDVRSEERARILRISPFVEETRATVQAGIAKLDNAEKEAVRLLIVRGEMTDSQALQVLREKGLISGNQAGIFKRIADATQLVERVWPFDRGEALLGYTGPWRVNPSLKSILEAQLSSR